MGVSTPQRIALLSDIHANGLAFEACLRHASAQGADGFALLGDFVGYGPDVSEVVERVRQLREQGAWVIQGNHDAMAVEPPRNSQETGAQTAQWTHDRLSVAQRRFLAELPLTASVGDLLLVHASARQPATWEYVSDGLRAQRCLDAARHEWGAAWVCVGHVHQQRLYYGGNGRALMVFAPTPGVAVPIPRARAVVCTVGSVGQPRDGDPRAMYALFDGVGQRMTFHRVPYDHHAAAARVRAAGLPEFYARRLENAQ